MIKVGLTFDLKVDYLHLGYTNDEVAEFDAPETIDALDHAITSLGFEVTRIGNIFSLVDFLNSGNRCDLVFNICEGVYGIAREAQVPCLLDAYRIPYVFSEPDVLNLTLDKGLIKLFLKQAGIPTAEFNVISQLTDLQNIDIPFPLFVKPIAEGTSKGIDGFSLVNNQMQLGKSVNYLLTTYHQPVLVESFLSGREFTVGITGSSEDTKAIGTMEILLNEHAPHPFYSCSVKKDWEKYASYKIADDTVALKCAEIAVDIWKRIKGKDAGRIDFRLDASGNPNFIEVNPLAGLNPTYSDLPILARLSGISYNQLISEIMNSALKRSGIKNE
ncbi:MAG: D-alanine--D-alanine ligase [Bacteroidia bacterium]|nr:D-alanine--D-alanine ligase [Bacteroidia bacterium]